MNLFQLFNFPIKKHVDRKIKFMQIERSKIRYNELFNYEKSQNKLIHQLLNKSELNLMWIQLT